MFHISLKDFFVINFGLLATVHYKFKWTDLWVMQKICFVSTWCVEFTLGNFDILLRPKLPLFDPTIFLLERLSSKYDFFDRTVNSTKLSFFLWFLTLKTWKSSYCLNVKSFMASILNVCWHFAWYSFWHEECYNSRLMCESSL